MDASLLGTWDLDEYNQIAALDLDLLIWRSDVKDLFGFRAPAAFFRGNRDTIPGDQRPAETLPRSLATTTLCIASSLAEL